MNMKKRWIAATSFAYVLGLGVNSQAQQTVTLPSRQPVRLSSKIELDGGDSEIKLTSTVKEQPHTSTLTDHSIQQQHAEQTPLGTTFPQRRPLFSAAPELASKASSRFSELISRTSPGEPTSSTEAISNVSQLQYEAIPSTPQEEISYPAMESQSLGEPTFDEHQVSDHNIVAPMLATGCPIESVAPPYLPANTDYDALPWMAPYEDRAAMAPRFENSHLPSEVISHIPANFEPWWQRQLQNRIRESEHLLPVNVDALTIGALEHAPQIMALRTEPEIRYTYLHEARADFDWKTFIETKWQDINEPVGSTLITNADRFRNDIWYGKAGLKNKNLLGGEFEISQRLGYETQNSPFFVPPQQGTGRLQLNYTQPLLNGRGQAYNQSRMVLAQVEANKSFDEVAEELQDHLLKVSEAYWELYRARCAFLQRYKVLIAGEEILGTLDGRQEIDAQQRQVLRARAAVAGRRTDIVRAAASIRNAESRLRLLVNDPRLLEVGTIELIPVENPNNDYVPVSMAGSLQNALMFRPEISQAIRDLRAGGVRVGMAENELLPKLDLILETYTKGLAGDGNIAGGYGNQWSQGRPSYSVGLEFEYLLGNRAANARYTRRQQELAKAVYEFRTVVETGLTEVELAVRDVETTYREMLSQYQALVASETEAYYLEDRWRFLPGGDRSTTLLLEDLLDAQERLADTEADFVNAQVGHSIALTKVRREMGTLLQTPRQLAGTPPQETFIPSQETFTPSMPSNPTPMLAPTEFPTQKLKSPETIPPAPNF